MKRSSTVQGKGGLQRHPAARRGGVASVVGASAATRDIPPHKLQCFSVACNDMTHLEFGDKIVLPAKLLLELQCFQISTPMLFHIRAFGTQKGESDSEFTQYCSVQEFSAPDGHAFIPYWMMQNLQIVEGSDVAITTVAGIPRGIYCRLQPEDATFLDIAAEIGPKLLMESALRRYSILSVNETILIDYGGKRFYVKVLELKPSSVVSLLGDVDLELDFSAPSHANIRRPNSGSAQNAHGTDSATREEEHHGNTLISVKEKVTHPDNISVPVGYGRRLVDGVCVGDPESAKKCQNLPSQNKNRTLGSSSFHAAKQKLQATSAPSDVKTTVLAAKADTDSLAKDVRHAQAAFSSVGQRLGGRQDDFVCRSSVRDDLPALTTSCLVVPANQNTICSLCLAEISPAIMSLHTVRCTRNPGYHKYECSICNEKVLERDRSSHHHCDQCQQLFSSEPDKHSHVEAAHSSNHPCPDCGARFTLLKLNEHQKDTCLHSQELCALCGLKFNRKDLLNHKAACSSRTERCDSCHKYVKIVDLDHHTIACASDRALTNRTDTHLPSHRVEEAIPPKVTPMECVYCAKQAFGDSRQLERHVNQECLVARSFRAPLTTAKPTAYGSETLVKSLIQGKLRRHQDAKTLVESSSSLAFDSALLGHRSNQLEPTQTRSSRSNPLVRAISPKAGASKARSKPQPKRRPTQLESMRPKPMPPPITATDSDPTAAMFIGTSFTRSNLSRSVHPRATTKKLQRLNSS